MPLDPAYVERGHRHIALIRAQLGRSSPTAEPVEATETIRVDEAKVRIEAAVAAERQRMRIHVELLEDEVRRASFGS